MSELIRRRGQRAYEMSNHLGNVLSVVSDYKEGVVNGNPWEAEYYEARVLSANDYYAFGLVMPGRKFNSPEYRYGFNGKEKDESGELGNLTHYDYGFRIYNPGIGKFLSVDPLTSGYPWYTPYQFAGNKPIRYIDIDGLEEGNADEEGENEKISKPGIGRTAWNTFTGQHFKSRAQGYAYGLQQNSQVSDISMVDINNNTRLVIAKVLRNTISNDGEENISTKSYEEKRISIFRTAKRQGLILGTSLDNDDINLSENQFFDLLEKGDVSGIDILDFPNPGAAGGNSAGALLAGSKDIIYAARQSAKTLISWQKQIRIGVNDKDLLAKGFHLHFDKGLELGLRTTGEGKFGLTIVGKKNFTQLEINNAVDVFNQALNSRHFKTELLQRTLDTQQWLVNYAKTGARDSQAAINRAHELNYIIKSIINIW